jgi:Family of unknown function (DUF5990)
MQPELPLRVTVVGVPPGVTCCLQRGGRALIPPSQATAVEISFDLTVRLGAVLPDGRPNLLGQFAQGPRGGRFLHVNSGTCAGQADPRWTRRAWIVFAPGIAPVLGVAAAYVSWVALGHALMRLVAGPARGDKLRARAWKIAS